MICENSGKESESKLCIGCSSSALTGALEKGANVGLELHLVCNLVSLKQEI
jgi:hypothetical protein